MSNHFDIFDNLNSYLNKSDDCDIPDDDDLAENSVDSIANEDPVQTQTNVGKKQSLSKEIKKKSVVDPKQPSSKQETLIPSGPVEKSEEPQNLATSSDRTVNLIDDLDQQMKDLQHQYDMIFGKNSSCTPTDKKYFAQLKKRYNTLMKQQTAPTRRSSRGRQNSNSFTADLESLKEIFFNICVNYNLIAPVSVCPAPETREIGAGRRSRRTRQQEPELINLVDSPALIIPGTINLDSDEEEVVLDVANKSSNQSFELENYEISVKVKWQGKIERFVHRKHQKFADLIRQLADRNGADPNFVILNLNERIINPNDTPDTIGYRISQFISGRVVEGSLANMFTGKQTCTTNKIAPNSNGIILKVQSERWRQPLEVPIEKHQKMRIVVIKCAEELKCNPGQIKLSFDGDTVGMDSTPLDLELDGALAYGIESLV
ncbi:DNA repair protein Rad60 isoform X2 [Toxorhynchites rutilus septentrionalis]|uniref:DNA repair protein Rad60 isoform X2 n=1 Tax=Toxorhynchites rutilus septentrionalis TaxID=329112 RepID=UPI002479A973|nr:DNA repair protein Rad60 isoform X2 [Toxorhynchites rutilus septentrionalis]XP_055616263.1 DNA repair protein Rad60 isoform X2 [Toxorhynchites rutilus septentrionalis]XP_055616264.1 DNA repair protein Rad60 isoform X2 [Toxorhynchites rutilus septentrionalis]XP_055616265.1 DNA repair protein Rad60 isoform X2 [Toxorhynchites rutilus septentrionalis]